VRKLLAGLLISATLVPTAVRETPAGMLAACEAPSGFAGPVQVFVLQYGFDPSALEADQRLVETARRLSYLIQLDVLANDSYGSIASILLQEERPGSCLAGAVQNRLLDSGALQPGQAVALEWGRIYREGDDVLVQTYLRFLRVDPQERRFADERFTVALSDPPARLEGSLPTQSIAFPPRRLSAEQLDRIDADWREAARLYDLPDASGRARELPSPDERFAYFVREMTADGWLGVELSQGGGRGWLKADPEVGRSLRELLPELHFLEGVIGYLSYRQAADGRGFPVPPARWMLERIERNLSRFIDPPGEASMLALTLRGTLQAFATADRTAAGLELLREALGRQPEDGKLRNLVAMAELRQCCAGDGTSPSLKQIPQMLLAGLAVDPNNTELLANLQATYAWLAGQPAGSESRRTALATGVVRVNANLRAEPSTDAPVVGLVQGGSRIELNGTDGGGQWLRVDRGAEPDAFVAARLIGDLQPSELECGREISTDLCAALRSGPQDPQEFAALPELFERLEQAQARSFQGTSSRLAVAGLTAAEVGTRLEQIQELRQALGELN
jgi:Bacterial SH3 domain